VLVREADGSERTMRLDPLEERHRERERAKREAQERERREHEGERTFGRLVELWLAARLKQKMHSIIPLNDRAVGLLQGLHDEANGSPFVFPGDRRGQPLKNIVRPWHQIRETAKLEHVRIHDLRHIFTTKALDAGGSLDDIAPLLGHKSTAMTRTYAHRNIEALREATDKAGKLLAAPDDRAGA
jgi:integrase-like protein